MPTWEIYTYGNGEFLGLIFNGVVALIGDNDYVTLMRLAAMFGLFWVIVRAALYKGPVEWTYLIWFVLIYGALFVPKVNVTVVDRLDPAQTVTVANVPLGLGAFAGITAHIGDWLTRNEEAVMSLPSDLQYQSNGMIFGSRLVEAASQFQITDGRFAANMSEFMQQCAFYDILFHRYTWTQVLEAEDTWDFIRTNTSSTSRAFSYIHANGTEEIMICQVGAVTNLTTDWNAEVARASQLYGLRFNPNLSMANAAAKLMNDLPNSYNYLTSVTKNGGDIIRANMMANLFRQSFSNAAASADASAAAQAFATAQAEEQQRSTYAVMGNLASKFLPLLKNIYEGLLYGVFPFLFLIFMLPFGGKVFLSYLKNIVWLQLWAPLYAILNLLITLHAHKASMAAAAQVGGQALSLATHSGLAAVNADAAIIAGYMGMSIPLIAYGLVSGGQMALTQMASQVAGVAQGSAMQAGARVATGSAGLGNIGAYNTGMFQSEAMPATAMAMGQGAALHGNAMQQTGGGAEISTAMTSSAGAPTGGMVTGSGISFGSKAAPPVSGADAGTSPMTTSPDAQGAAMNAPGLNEPHVQQPAGGGASGEQSSSPAISSNNNSVSHNKQSSVPSESMPINKDKIVSALRSHDQGVLADVYRVLNGSDKNQANEMKELLAEATAEHAGVAAEMKRLEHRDTDTHFSWGAGINIGGGPDDMFSFHADFGSTENVGTSDTTEYKGNYGKAKKDIDEITNKVDSVFEEKGLKSSDYPVESAALFGKLYDERQTLEFGRDATKASHISKGDSSQPLTKGTKYEESEKQKNAEIITPNGA